MGVSLLDMFIYMVIPFGDLISRVTKMNGSIDHLWTLIPIFQLPILGVVPLLLMHLKVIKKGKLTFSPYDNFVFLAIILKFLSGAFTNSMDEPISSIYGEFSQIFSIMVVLLIRILSPRCSLCDKINTSFSQTLNIIFQLFKNSVLINLYIKIGIIITSYIPYLGTLIEGLQTLPYLGNTFLFALFLVPCYIINNMVIENKWKRFCRSDKPKIKDIIVTIISLSATFGIRKLNEYI